MKKSGSAPALNSKSVPKPEDTKKSSGITLGRGISTSKTASEPEKTIQKPIELSPLQTPEGILEYISQDEISKIRQVRGLLTLSSNLNSFANSDLIVILKHNGASSSDGSLILSTILSLVEEGQEGGLLLFLSLLQTFGSSIEPFVIELLPRLFKLHADRSAPVRETVAKCCQLISSLFLPASFRLLLPKIAGSLSSELDWREKVAALEFLKAIAPRMASQLSPLLPTLIPLVSECIIDPKKQVSTAGQEALLEACRAINNDDIRHLVPQLVSVIARPDETPKTLDLLLETTFVTNVDQSTLALIGPLLGKALRGRSSVVKRKAARVIDIMGKLVQEPSMVAPFVPLLLPALDKVIDEIVDPEIREVATAARAVVLKAMGFDSSANSSEAAAALETRTAEEAASHPESLAPIESGLREAVVNFCPLLDLALPFNSSVISYVAQLLARYIQYEAQPRFSPEMPTDPALFVPRKEVWRHGIALAPPSEFNQYVIPYVSLLSIPQPTSLVSSVPEEEEAVGLPTDEDSESSTPIPPVSTPQAMLEARAQNAEIFADDFRKAALGDVPDRQDEEEEDGSNLCNIEFSLAFGGKILLHNTHLKLGRGRRYGVMGKNGAGKTTLLTNIGTGNIEGIPEHLKTVYVQHDDASDDQGVPLLDEISASPQLTSAGVSREEAQSALTAIGFTSEMLSNPRSALSGGWKMKVLIVRAMLTRANVLLLDEPTNHLDAASVAWLTQYLQAATDVTCLIVSHDTAFLDAVTTDIIHYEGKKLVYYHGNLSHFVSLHPEAKYYFELEGSSLRFKFPTPERLDGINSNTRAVLKMDNVFYTYPGASKPTLSDVNVKLCLGSRVVVIGANGAGKSTLIRLMVQELVPDTGVGEVWKHRNLRVAYVAQHSLHHVEQHLNLSPVDYIKWRFAGGVDREDLVRPSQMMTEEEEEVRKEERKYGDVEQIIGRRKNGRTMEYECTFFGQTKRDENKYITLERLTEMGLQKMVQACDTRIAAMAAGLDLRPLLIAEIQGHLDDFALEAEYGTHSTIRRLSGGQKVKLVLAAAMWNRPHILVLDEPTNYLDREALGALTQAIKTFNGGVIIISHNKEFTDAICTESWTVKNGVVATEGGIEEESSVKSRSIKKSKSATQMESFDGQVANTNTSIVSEVILNPRTLEGLSKKETRLLTRCAQVAGVSLKDYVSKITCTSPEWKWL